MHTDIKTTRLTVRVALLAVFAALSALVPAAAGTADRVNVAAFEVPGGPLVAYRINNGSLEIIETDASGAKALSARGYRTEAVLTSTLTTTQLTSDGDDTTENAEITAEAPPTVPSDGAKVAIVDSGVNVNHPWLAGHIAAVGDLTGVMEDPWESAQSTTKVVEEPWYDGNGHGTHVAGILRQNYPNVQIVVAKALNNRGSADSTWIARAITWAVDMDVDVINLSLGYIENSVVIREAVNLAVSKGIIVVAAAGNWGHDGSPRFFPASLPGVVAVASTDADGNLSYFSNRGDYVDIAARGSSVVSAGRDGGLLKLSGTSMATPKVAAVLAEIRHRNPSWSAEQVINHVLATATDAGPTGPDGAYGYGIVNAELARNTAEMQTPTGSVALPSLKFNFKNKGQRIRISDLSGQVDTLRVLRLDGRFELPFDLPYNQAMDCFCFGRNDTHWSIKSVSERLVLRATGPWGIPYQPVIIDTYEGQKPRIVKNDIRRP